MKRFIKNAVRFGLASLTLGGIASVAATSNAGMSASAGAAYCVTYSGGGECQGSLTGFHTSSDPNAEAIFTENTVTSGPTRVSFWAHLNNGYYSCALTTPTPLTIGPTDGFSVWFDSNYNCTGIQVQPASALPLGPL